MEGFIQNATEKFVGANAKVAVTLLLFPCNAPLIFPGTQTGLPTNMPL
jgi:hypothetical protein